MTKRTSRAARPRNTRPAWYAFQEQIAAHFRALGAQAETNVKVNGNRTTHDLDVLVTSKFLGVDIKWVVEAKHWKKRVPKEKILALRAIMDEIGADRGFIISEAGFQRGAREATEKTNVSLMTLEEFKASTRKIVQIEMLRGFGVRLVILHRRYWSHSKSTRIDYGLRSDIYDSFDSHFSGQELLGSVHGALLLAEENKYPIRTRGSSRIRVGEDVIENFVELVNWMNLNMNVLDEMLMYAEYAMIRKGEFNPNIERGNGSAKDAWEAMKHDSLQATSRAVYFESHGSVTRTDVQD